MVRASVDEVGRDRVSTRILRSGPLGRPQRALHSSHPYDRQVQPVRLHREILQRIYTALQTFSSRCCFCSQLERWPRLHSPRIELAGVSMLLVFRSTFRRTLVVVLLLSGFLISGCDKSPRRYIPESCRTSSACISTRPRMPFTTRATRKFGTSTAKKGDRPSSIATGW